MKTYKIKIRLDNDETDVIEVKAENWETLVNYVFGRIEIIDTEEG